MALATYHIHITGQVQGVGFRPYCYQLALRMNIAGQVSNGSNGVHIYITTDSASAELYYETIVKYPPENAIILAHSMNKIACINFTSFSIAPSNITDGTNMLLTPDIAICSSCKREISTITDKRYRYAFTSCVHCGPRYSIIKALPYDRDTTTMSSLQMCPSCEEEYRNPSDRRFHSQINTCKSCAINIHLYVTPIKEYDGLTADLLHVVTKEIIAGKIIAVKGLGGYLLMCDATNGKTVSSLRIRKRRPSKPFALLYANIKMAERDVYIRTCEKEMLESKSAPIVLCRKKKHSQNKLAASVAPQLDKLGIMLPSSPLLFLLSNTFGKPLIATSANISGSPIIYKDDDALKYLFEIADYVLTYERDIVTPQDDSVLQFTETGELIILRRSRGMAPNYIADHIAGTEQTIIATGAELKSAFAFSGSQHIYVSQYLGDMGNSTTQECYADTLTHLTKIIRVKPDIIVADKHPYYHVTQFAHAYAQQHNIRETYMVQHHKAHFSAVLAENDLLCPAKPIAGFIWDGTGYGDDSQAWGGETFLYDKGKITRNAHLKYFPVLLGDKMSREPRLSALSLLKEVSHLPPKLVKMFTANEIKLYEKMLATENTIYTSSVGRLLDGIAAILGIAKISRYEGEAVLHMESLARRCKQYPEDYYEMPLIDGIIDWQKLIVQLVEDSLRENKAKLCYKVFYSLARSISTISNVLNVDVLAFSGGVFQNALLIDLIIKEMGGKKELYFHKQLSPNDENIGFGQLVYVAQKIDTGSSVLFQSE